MNTYAATKFKSINDLKKHGECFRKGQIIPRRILACDERKEQYLWRFGANCVAIPTPTGYVVHVEHADDDFECAIRVVSKYKRSCLVGQKPVKQCYSATGSIYSTGDTIFLGNHNKDYIETLSEINKQVRLKYEI